MKLTLITLYCRDKKVQSFTELPTVKGKTIMPASLISKLFLKNHGFEPETGETISIG